MTTNHDDGFYTKQEVRALIRLSFASMARLIAKQRFPQPVPLPGVNDKGRGTVGVYRNSRRVFLKREIHAWMDDTVRAARALLVS
jgi:hypothetical protein